MLALFQVFGFKSGDLVLPLGSLFGLGKSVFLLGDDLVCGDEKLLNLLLVRVGVR